MYHHGDLYQALIDVGTTLSREGGPEAITIRRATREAETSPTAAYRHFPDRQALVLTVAEQVQDLMLSTIDQQSPQDGSLRSRYTVYLRFARDEPGWHRLITLGPSQLQPSRNPPPSPAEALILKIHAGHPHHWSRWAAIHGLAALISERLLPTTNDTDLDHLIEDTVTLALQDTAPRKSKGAPSTHPG